MPFTDPSQPDHRADERPSKTQLKKQSHDLQALGLALAEMPDDRLAALPVDESLIEAVRAYRRTRTHEGRRRQLQYIGKLMRHVDPEPLREAVAALQVPRAADTLALHQAEHWRDQLIADDEAVTRWMAEHPQTDAQRLRSLVRSARKEAASASPEQRHGRSYRELFQMIKQQMSADA
jgi:ribosome-associated protein